MRIARLPLPLVAGLKQVIKTTWHIYESSECFVVFCKSFNLTPLAKSGVAGQFAKSNI